MSNLRDQQKKQKLLLHACCAPCSPHIAATLSGEYDVTLFFFNPNIYPDSERRMRQDEARRFCSGADFPLVVVEGDHSAWLDAARGRETDPEGGPRCAICFRMRLETAASYAAENGFDRIATTLSVSPHKNAAVINAEGAAAAQKFGVEFLAADFKKQDGFLKSCRLAAEHGMKRQNYCGCEFSMR